MNAINNEKIQMLATLFISSQLKFSKNVKIFNPKMENQTKILEYLTTVERLAQEILSDKREVTMLDKRRNQNREALRELSKSGQSKCWVTIGSVLVKQSLEVTKKLLESDQNQLNIDINKLRSDLKVKVNVLRDKEMQPPVPGLMLVPMSQKESDCFSQSGLFS